MKKFSDYREEVDLLTEITIRKYKNRIKDIELRGRKFKKSLDHKFSAIRGFENNIDPKIIANINNLEIVDYCSNSKKYIKCSISLEELLKTYEE